MPVRIPDNNAEADRVPPASVEAAAADNFPLLLVADHLVLVDTNY